MILLGKGPVSVHHDSIDLNILLIYFMAILLGSYELTSNPSENMDATTT